MALTESLFIGIRPAGISYADRAREEHGDYARVAFLDYDTLTFKAEAGALPELVEEARKHAEGIQALRGQPFEVSTCGQTVLLGRLLAPASPANPDKNPDKVSGSALELCYTPSEGVTLHGTSRADAPRIKAARDNWRWWREGSCWYIPRTRDKVLSLGIVELYAKNLREQGLVVTVEHTLEGGVRPASEREADEKARAEARVERLEDRADRLDSKAESHAKAARTIADCIPMGQPILVGHHSEKRHRSDLAKIDTNMRKGIKAGEAAADARGSIRATEGRIRRLEGKDAGAVLRKIGRLEVELRDVDRKLKGTSVAAGYGTPASGDWREALEVRKAAIVDEIGHLRAKLPEDLPGPTKFRRGDVVTTRRHGPGRVDRVNAKTLSVHLLQAPYLPECMKDVKIPYDENPCLVPETKEETS